MLQEQMLAGDEQIVALWRPADHGRDVHREDICTLFTLLDSKNTDALMGFLETSKRTGIDLLVVIIDLWKTCRTMLANVLPGAARQLCVSSIIWCVIGHTYKTILIYYCELPREARTKRTAKNELWDLRCLLLKAGAPLSEKEQDALGDLLCAHQSTVLAQAYNCKEAIVTLFQSSRTKEEARAGRDRVVRQFGDVPELQEVISLIEGNEFEQMIGYLQSGEVPLVAAQAVQEQMRSIRRKQNASRKSVCAR